MTFTEFTEKFKADHPPTGKEPSTAAPGDHPGETNFIQQPKPNPLGTPKNSVLKRMSALAKFRQSSVYKKIKDRLRDQSNASAEMNASDETFTPANLKERAEAMIDYVQGGGTVENLFRVLNDRKIIVETEMDFVDSIISMLIDAGFDENLVEVEAGKGGEVLIYLDQKAEAKKKNIRSILSEVAEVELVASPDENPDLGTFVYKVTAHDHGDAAVHAVKESKKGEECLTAKKPKGNGVAPQPDTRNKKGQRVMHDKEETFTPARSRTVSKPKPKKGSREQVWGDRARSELKKHRTNWTAKKTYTRHDKPWMKSEDTFTKYEDDHEMHSKVWVVVDDCPCEGTVIDITDYGKSSEEYQVRLDDGFIQKFYKGDVHSTRKEAVKKANKWRSPEDKIESFQENLGSNPAPSAGDIILDTRTRKHFEVKRVLTNGRVEVQLTDGTQGQGGGSRFVGDPRVERTDVIEKGLTSGTMKRLKSVKFTESETFSVDLHTCPNCVIPLKAEGDSFLCTSCEFVAEFADAL